MQRIKISASLIRIMVIKLLKNIAYFEGEEGRPRTKDDPTSQTDCSTQSAESVGAGARFTLH